MESITLDAAGHRRSPATMPGYHNGRPPRNRGMRYPADPPTIEEIVAVMRVAGEKPDGLRLRALIVLLWRAGLRIGEALALAETDLDRSRGAVRPCPHSANDQRHRRARQAVIHQAAGTVPADRRPYPRLARSKSSAYLAQESCIARATCTVGLSPEEKRLWRAPTCDLWWRR
jgi:integrase